MLFLILPLVCGLLYPVGTLLVKRSLDKGMDIWSVAVVNYWIMALVFLPVLFLDSRPIPWSLWYQPASMGLCSFLGQAFAFKAISSGDLTIATPALGSKVLLVALLTVVLLGESVPGHLWIAALCSFGALFYLQAGVKTARRKVFLTLSFSLLAAASFALGDVLIQKWSPRWGVFHFVPAFAIATAVYSMALWPLMKKPRLVFPAASWKWALAGNTVLGLQSLGFTVAIGLFGQVTRANIIFSSRGLWSFLLIWFGGHWFSNREREVGSRIMGYRLLGAVLMFAAIILASWK